VAAAVRSRHAASCPHSELPRPCSGHSQVRRSTVGATRRLRGCGHVSITRLQVRAHARLTFQEVTPAWRALGGGVPVTSGVPFGTCLWHRQDHRPREPWRTGEHATRNESLDWYEPYGAPARARRTTQGTSQRARYDGRRCRGTTPLLRHQDQSA
jgi:hypothetical protein